MNQGEIFTQTIERKKQRLDELARLPMGERFLHHTVLSNNGTGRSSIPYTIVKHGLLNLRDRKALEETKFESPNTWDSTSYQPVYFLDDSKNSFRIGSSSDQLISFMVDPAILNEMKHYRTTADSPDLFDSYEGEITIPESVASKHILGAIVPEWGHNLLYHLQTRPQDLGKLEREDKESYKNFDIRTKVGTLRERDPNDDGISVGSGKFYRGLAWGMKDFPENAFPVFSGFSSVHFPYESGADNFFTGEYNPEDEIPLEYYLAGQIFPLTSEAHLKHIAKDMIEKAGNSPRQIGLIERCISGSITPEEMLGRELTLEEKRMYSAVNPAYAEAQNPAEVQGQYSKPVEGDVYERRKLILGVEE